MKNMTSCRNNVGPFMLRLLFVFAATALLSMNAMAQKKAQKRVLVAYFSATGTTAAAARQLADVAGATLYAVTPAKHYTAADLDWNDKSSRSSVEMANAKSRPALGGRKIDVSAYDVVFIGYPIWWNLAPRVINTFIESHNLAGKTVVPFATSGGSSIDNSAKELKKTYGKLVWKEGRLMNGMSRTDIKKWVEALK